MAFAAKPTPAWMASALLLGVTANSVFAQVPGGPVPAAPQTLAVASNQVTADAVLLWLNAAADAVAKNDANAASQNFAEALRGRRMLSAPSDAVEKRLREVESSLLTAGVRKQQIQDAINALRPIENSLQALAMQGTPGVNAAGPAPAGQPVAPPLPGFLPALPPSAVTPANGQQIAGAPSGVQSGVFNPAVDTTQLQAAGASSVRPASLALGAQTADELYRQGVEALGRGDRTRALELFRQAWQQQGELDPALRTQLKDKLSALQAADMRPAGSPEQITGTMVESQEQLLMRSRLMSEVTGEVAAAEANREFEPLLVAERLQSLRTKVSQADLDGASRKQMLSIVDRAITSHQVYLSQNRASIDQNMRNRQIEEQISLERETGYKIDQQIASLVETYNDLFEEQRYAEAEMVAKQVGQLKPNSEIATLMYSNARLAKRDAEYNRTRNIRQDNFIDMMNDVDRAAIGMTDKEPIQYTDSKSWLDLSGRRARLASADRRGMSPAESAIWDKLQQPVLVDFQARPLSEVVKILGDMTGILIHIDQAGLASEGLTADLPITLSLNSQIKLRSALNLILNNHNLDFVVRNEVLMITSTRSTAQANRTETYSVSDLVIPIPNFTTDYNSGMAGALRAAYESIGNGLAAQVRNTGGLGGAQYQMASASMNPNSSVLGQMNPGMGGLQGFLPMGGGGSINSGQPTFGQGGAVPISGGPAPATFDDLISLIQGTVDPDSWQSNGGSSSITPFPGNLSLVVSAPQTTHEKLADLLEALRRLQDLQVTIEVRFITLNDNFFERIGVDFDLRIDDNYRGGPLPDDRGRSVTIGLNSPFAGAIAPTADLDLTFRQDSFTGAIPAFGGFNADQAGQFGFAILSDLEMFFFLSASQGDQRTSVLQAPRVTMFDGQQASISDTVSRPFVISLTPVVGDFAVGQQPVIVVINEGTVLNVQAVVSQDKKYVRLTLEPTFSRIDRVEQFTFQGETTSKSGTAIIDPATGKPVNNSQNDNRETRTVGTTVQQPVLASTQVSTTVSVPDGGTILLGGIKRMREGRIERGIPILSKIPYLNRLFKNTSIGRETSTLMLTVTPRIIIQEEEEALLLGNNP
jgi:general secretion pathway protein D